jgi:hypothetical protein
MQVTHPQLFKCQTQAQHDYLIATDAQISTEYILIQLNIVSAFIINALYFIINAPALLNDVAALNLIATDEQICTEDFLNFLLLPLCLHFAFLCGYDSHVNKKLRYNTLNFPIFELFLISNKLTGND